MRNKISYILKHNFFFQKLYIIIMSLVFKFIGLFIRTDNELILFVSFSGKKYGDSPKVIYDLMQNDLDFKKYRKIWAFEDPNAYPEINSVKIDTLKYFITAIKAKYWITDTNIERGLHFKKKNTLYLNTWHGTAMKKIGNDSNNRREYNFNNIDYFTVQGEYDEFVFKSALGISEKSILKCGLPRNDVLWNADKTKYQNIREKLFLHYDKTVILYAPTWRDSKDNGKTYSLDLPIDFNKWKDKLGDNYIVLFRSHILTTDVTGINESNFVIDVSDYEDVNDLLIVSDILITDYSSIAFDYAILNRPILCYAYDYLEYIKHSGLYFDLNKKLPSEIIKTEDELIERILNLDFIEEREKTLRFRKEFVNYGGNAATECIKVLKNANQMNRG